MNRDARRPIVALVVAALLVGAWLMFPRFATPADPVALSGPSQATGLDGVPTSNVPASTAPVATSPAPGSSTDPDVSGPIPSGPLPSGPVATGPVASGPLPSAPAPTASALPTPVPGSTTSATPKVRAALDARLERLRTKYGLPGISAAILFADGSLWQGTAGLADVAARRPVTSETAFSVASVSKTFTSALILALVEDGRLGLDSSAKSYLKTLPISPKITIRQLLDHTSGLRDFYYGPGVDHALLSKPARVWTAARSLSYLRKPFAKPGTSWHYSNTNYLVLGMIAEAVGGAPVADQLRDRFFRPLGLDRTFYQAVDKPAGPLAHGYRFTGTATALPAIDLSDGTGVVPFTSVVTSAGAAGSIATTARDLATWAQALYGGDLLEPASREAMVADILRTARYKPTVAYGLGVQEVQVAGHRALGHSGRFLGTRAAVRWLPDDRMALAVLTNQSRRDVNVILANLLKVALREQP